MSAAAASPDHRVTQQAAPELVRIRRALLSVSDKGGVVELARALRRHGVELISTGGTAKALHDAGLEVTPIEAVTGFPEMMDGRVKTLHPKVHGGLLARRDNADHVDSMAAHGIAPIDLVCINLYPFEQTVARPGVSLPEAIEQIDIGGPSMVRSAAKNSDFVAVITDPTQYASVIEALDATKGSIPLSLRRALAASAFARTGAYDAAIAAYLAASGEAASRTGGGAGGGGDPTAPFPPTLADASWQSSLRYGENAHQNAALYVFSSTSPAHSGAAGASVAGHPLLHGKELSYNNLLDASAALEVVEDLTHLMGSAAFADGSRRGFAAVVVKHTNPCGAAIAERLEEAFAEAHSGDPLAAYGGIVALSAEVDLDTARAITQGEKFLEVIVAPSFAPDALRLIGERWKNVRLLAVGEFDRAERRAALMIRSIPGGLLVEERDIALPDPATWRLATAGAGSTIGDSDQRALVRSAAFGVVISKHLKSNAVCIVRGTTLIGAGAGQMDRVASCRIALEKAGPRLRGDGAPPLAASDAFFPFDDGPRLLLDGGVTCLVHPGGSKRDEDTIALCRERGASCWITGVRHFRH